MNSSTSDSDISVCAASGIVWGRWLRVFFATLVTGTISLYAALVLVDPYDSGRFPGLGIAGFADENPRTAGAARARSAQFNAAIIGNSTAMRLDPNRLSPATGLSFVQLAVTATGPREQMTLLRWFIVNHQRIGAIVIDTDDTWCTQEEAPPLVFPFPFWLYGSNLEYLRNLLSSHSVDLAIRRLAIGLGLRQPSDPVGYVHPGEWPFQPGDPPAQLPPGPAAFAFPWIGQLQAMVADLPPSVPIVLFMPPVLYTWMPEPGSRSAARLEQCKAALATVVAGRPAAHFLDFRVDDATTRDSHNFLDPRHYREHIARRLEDAIATATRSAQARAVDCRDFWPPSTGPVSSCPVLSNVESASARLSRMRSGPGE
jgi:hypothetical protein